MKKILALMTAFAMVFSMAACGNVAGDNNAVTQTKPETITIQALNANQELVDVEVPYDPQRIAILDMPALDIVDALGLGERIVVYRHALKNSMIPVITIFGQSIPHLFGGAYITEKVFGWPGMGLLGVEAIANRDYQILMGLTLFTAVLVMLGNLLSDIMYSVVDPRIRY